jgi:hypothetical protein
VNDEQSHTFVKHLLYGHSLLQSLEQAGFQPAGFGESIRTDEDAWSLVRNTQDDFATALVCQRYDVLNELVEAEAVFRFFELETCTLGCTQPSSQLRGARRAEARFKAKLNGRGFSCLDLGECIHGLPRVMREVYGDRRFLKLARLCARLMALL